MSVERPARDALASITKGEIKENRTRTTENRRYCRLYATINAIGTDSIGRQEAIVVEALSNPEIFSTSASVMGTQIGDLLTSPVSEAEKEKFWQTGAGYLARASRAHDPGSKRLHILHFSTDREALSRQRGEVRIGASYTRLSMQALHLERLVQQLERQGFLDAKERCRRLSWQSRPIQTFSNGILLRHLLWPATALWSWGCID